jgi:hypothetical protein
LTVDLVDLLFRFVILGSPETPKGPGEGAPVAGLVAGNRRQRPDSFRAAGVDFADSTLPREMLSPTLAVYRNLLSNQGLLWPLSL